MQVGCVCDLGIITNELALLVAIMSVLTHIQIDAYIKR